MMDNDELRRAVELAGLQVSKSGLVTIGEGVHAYTSSLQNPMLPDYVAGRLVAKVWATRHHKRDMTVDIFLDSCDTASRDDFFATKTQRIRAAVAALEPTNTEQGEGND